MMPARLTRRDLLSLLLASAVAEAVDVERLLWTPRPLITVPSSSLLPDVMPDGFRMVYRVAFDLNEALMRGLSGETNIRIHRVE